jgi:hypothetical protein
MINNPYSSAIKERRCLICQINQALVSRRERQCVDMNETCNSWHGVLVFGITKVSPVKCSSLQAADFFHTGFMSG